MSGGVRGIQYADFWRVTCPVCKVAPYTRCVRLDGSGAEIKGRHAARVTLGRMYRPLS
jgi:hypothetical protein